MIEVGAKAPDFKLDSQLGEFALSQFAGKKVMLVFYPLDWTPN